MKNFIYLIALVVLFSACKNEKDHSPKKESLTIAEKIANAHGFEHWKKVSEIQFTFAGNRHWIWHPKTDDITLSTSKDTISYNRKSMDSLSLKVDPAFINDKFWLLIPFQLVWDEGLNISEPIKSNAPISKTEMNKITLTYSNEGGYTPGDAYDLFYTDDFLIKEWVFRKGNAETPSLTNTFENHQTFNGIKIALDHKKAEGDWNLKLTNVGVKVTVK